MKTYPIKLSESQVEKLREIQTPDRYGFRQYTSDSLRVPLSAFYAKDRYSTRTAKSYPGNWKTDYIGPKSQKPWFCDTWPEWRDLGDAHENARIDHTGWYCDHFREGVIRGRVLQLPARNGDPIYVPGTYCTEWDGVTVYPLDWYETPEEAAKAADQYAEREAEESREFYAKDAADQDIDRAHEEAKEAIQQFRELKTTIKGKAYDDPVCSLIRRELKSLRREVTRQISIIQARRDDFWTAV